MKLRDILLRFPGYEDLHAIARDEARLKAVIDYLNNGTCGGFAQVEYDAGIVKKAYINAANQNVSAIRINPDTLEISAA